MSNVINVESWIGPLDRWRICPSTHCARWEECRSPHECSGTGKNLSPEKRAEIRAGIADSSLARAPQEKA